MKRLRTKVLSLSNESDLPAVLNQLAKKFEVEESGASSEDRTYYDTFDWRLYRDHLVFFSSGGRLSLQRFSGRNIAEGPGRKRARYLVSDIGSQKLSAQLKKRIEMRALVPIVEVATLATEFRIMNRDRKTVARMSLRDDQPAHSDATLPELVAITEIRGYEQEFESIADCFEKRGCESIKKRHLVQRLLDQGERLPEHYGDKFNVVLAPDVKIGQAVVQICLHLVDDMKTNEPGIIDDIDTEFLHDFRIALRRTRSLLSLMKNVLPAESGAYFQKELGWLGSVTGPLRDLDVYLLEKDNYLDLLPKSLRSGMHCFFEQIESRRADEIKILQKHLASPRYANLIGDWRVFLEQPDSGLHDGAGADRCRDFADRLILKRFNSFLRHGNAIDDSSPDKTLHKLRIRGKKFRYLLEFFKSFYDQKEMDAFLKHMKKLQDNLGTFNDLSVQQDMLTAELEALRGRNLESLRFAASLGGLVGILSEKHKAVRAQFESTYAAFAQPQVRSILYSLVEN
jgi:CHAD domain-containing protein